ncbi:hypothetical protein [Shimazuella kribbensis]|uniref:hypothetical protein n=1 Tax=Shimazuella kribbensis TaxID=139808 RepID=UPI0003FD9EF4|nr:hypothetical protein [Shimazuella kribbensis]
MLFGLDLSDEYELISLFCAVPKYEPESLDIDNSSKEHFYEFETTMEKVNISFSPIVNNFSIQTHDLNTKEELFSLHLQDRVRSLKILCDTKEKAIFQLNCSYPLEDGIQKHAVSNVIDK